MLQFRASTVDAICDPKCVVDCWVFPRYNPNGTPLRSAFYHLLVQGFRRCQGMWSFSPKFYHMAPDRRPFFDGQPLWKIDGRLDAKPWGHRRRVDPDCGAFYWTNTEGQEKLVDEEGRTAWDTMSFWATPLPPVVEDMDDLYS